MNQSLNLSAERIESLKAGTLAALSLTLTYILVAVGNSLVLAESFTQLAALQVTIPIDFLIRVAVTWLSGLLFGVTYRYVIREDNNSHLKDGAALAFGLVRGLAPVEGQQNLTDAFWLVGVLGIENILCFLIARFTLDWAIHYGWIKPFKSTSVP